MPLPYIFLHWCDTIAISQRFPIFMSVMFRGWLAVDLGCRKVCMVAMILSLLLSSFGDVFVVARVVLSSLILMQICGNRVQVSSKRKVIPSHVYVKDRRWPSNTESLWRCRICLLGGVRRITLSRICLLGGARLDNTQKWSWSRIKAHNWTTWCNGSRYNESVVLQIRVKRRILDDLREKQWFFMCRFWWWRWEYTHFQMLGGAWRNAVRLCARKTVLIKRKH